VTSEERKSAEGFVQKMLSLCDEKEAFAVKHGWLAGEAECVLAVNRTITSPRGTAIPAVAPGQKALRGDTVVYGKRGEVESKVMVKVADLRAWTESLSRWLTEQADALPEEA